MRPKMSNYDYMEVWSGPLTSYGRGLLLWLVYRPGSFYYHKSSSLEDIPLNIPLILHSVVPTFKFLDLSFLSFSDCEPLNCSKSDPKMVLSTPHVPSIAYRGCHSSVLISCLVPVAEIKGFDVPLLYRLQCRRGVRSIMRRGF